MPSPSNLFMNGAKVKRQPVPETLYPLLISESKEYEQLSQIGPLDSGHVLVLFRESLENNPPHGLLSLYDISKDTMLINHVYDASGMVFFNPRTYQGKSYTDILLSLTSMVVLDNENLLTSTYPFIIDTIDFKEFAPYSLYNIKSVERVDSTFITEESYYGHVFVRKYSPTGLIMKNYPAYDIASCSYSDFWNGLYVKPDGTAAVMAMEFLDKLNFLDLHGDNHFTVITDKRTRDTHILNKKHTRFSDRCSFYRNAFVTDNYIYVIYNPGIPEAEAKDMATQPFLRVFTWDGIFKAQYKLNKSIFSFVVDEKNHFLIGITWENRIVQYLLP